MMFDRYCSRFLIIGFLLISESAFGLDCTWSAGDGNWIEAGKWSCGVVPDSDDDVTISSVVTVTMSSDVTVQSMNMSAGILTGAGVLTITGSFTWQAGRIELSEGTAASDLVASGPISINTSSGKTIGAGTTVQFDGDASWTNGTIFGESGSVLVNNGAFSFLTGADGFSWSVLPTPDAKLINNGSFIYNTLAIIGHFWAFENNSLFDFVFGGMIVQGTSFTNDDTLRVQNALNTMTLQGSSFENTGNGVVTGIGSLSFNSSFTNNGTFAPGLSPGIFEVTGVNSSWENSTLEIEIDSDSGPGTGHDQLAITGDGNLTGILNITHTSGYSPTSGDTFVIMTCSGTCTTDLSAPTSQPVGFNYGVASTGNEIIVGPDLNLPVELSRFEALVDGQTVMLRWETSSERDNAGFYIEALAGGDDWDQLGFVEGSGTVDDGRDYSFRTTELSTGIWQFRLKQVDFDGSFEYSPIVEAAIENPTSRALTTAYPNPFTDSATLELTVPAAQKVEVAIFDLHGRMVARLFDGLLEDTRTHRFSLDSSQWPSGSYLYRVRGESFEQTGALTVYK